MNSREKLQICHSCEHLEKKIVRPSMCNLCGCMVRIKVKLKNEECPAGKW